MNLLRSLVDPEISLVIPTNVRLTSLSCAVPATMQPGAAAAAPATSGTADVTFNGTTYTHQDVAEFMTRLGLIPQLMNIQLGTSTETPATTDATGGSTPATVTFTVTASLRPYTTAPPTTALQQGAAP